MHASTPIIWRSVKQIFRHPDDPHLPSTAWTRRSPILQTASVPALVKVGYATLIWWVDLKKICLWRPIAQTAVKNRNHHTMLSRCFTSIATGAPKQRLALNSCAALQQRTFSISSIVAGGHHAAAPKSQETLLQALSKRLPGKESAIAQRLEQLKRNHSKLCC